MAFLSRIVPRFLYFDLEIILMSAAHVSVFFSHKFSAQYPSMASAQMLPTWWRQNKIILYLSNFQIV